MIGSITVAHELAYTLANPKRCATQMYYRTSRLARKFHKQGLEVIDKKQAEQELNNMVMAVFKKTDPGLVSFIEIKISWQTSNNELSMTAIVQMNPLYHLMMKNNPAINDQRH